MTGGWRRVTTVHAVETARSGEDGVEHLDTVTVDASYTLENSAGEIEARERVVVDYAVKDGRATVDGVASLEEQRDAEGEFVATGVEDGLRPNALRAVPAAEAAVGGHPEVDDVQPVEEAFESCLEVGRANGGDGQ